MTGSTPANHSRASSSSSVSAAGNNQSRHPSIPSRLRQTHVPSSSRRTGRVHDQSASMESQQHLSSQSTRGVEVMTLENANGLSDRPDETQLSEEPESRSTEQTGLLEQQRNNAATASQYTLPNEHKCGQEVCNHGTTSPKARHRAIGNSLPSYLGTASPGGPSAVGDDVSMLDGRPGRSASILSGGVSRAFDSLGIPRPRFKRSTTKELARRHGVHASWAMYLTYYLPLAQWLPQYRFHHLRGDLTAALTVSSFYIPMSLSLASNLAHVPPIQGLYAFIFNPLVYAVLGTCPLMVVGPEAAGSLLTGGVVKEAINAGTHGEHQGQKHAQIAGMVTGLAGAFIFVAGICRLGFLDGVLSRPFLRGFISAIGITILIDQLIPEMGLDTAAARSTTAAHGSSLDKIIFLFRHSADAHRLTCAVAFSTIFIVLVLREIKRRLQPRKPWVAFIPDRFLVVVLSAVFAWAEDWESQGLDLMGDIRSKGKPFAAHWPFDESNFKHVENAFSTAFIIALLGFFESSVAAKSLDRSPPSSSSLERRESDDRDAPPDDKFDGIRGMNLSTNRELVALGVANLLGGLFMALPAFGGYGRSKVNASTGGKTPMSNVFIALITLICIIWLLPYFYYIPKATLSALITVVAVSLIEEAPHDIRFFLRIGGYLELGLMFLIFTTTVLWSLKIGIAVGIGLSLLRLLQHSTRPRIQILGRVKGRPGVFENAEHSAATVTRNDGNGNDDDELEMIPNCLIVKIPEPLTFANTGSLKDRLRRLEHLGSPSAHPALPRLRSPDQNQNLIFDVHGVTKLDPAACQVLVEIVAEYVGRGMRVFFCRVPGHRRGATGSAGAEGRVWRLFRVSGIVEMVGGERRFLSSVDEALRATEREESMLQG